jgi:anti-sigma regulatory factor (Ser/Thr protein kinase)
MVNVSRETSAERSHGIHRALLYETPEQLLEALVPFVTEGIAAGEHVLVVLAEEAEALLVERLGSHDGFDFIDSAEMYLVPAWTLAGYIAAVSDTTKNGRAMRVAAEPVWNGRSALEIEEWACFEAACNVAFGAMPLSILCPYDVSRLDQAIIDVAVATHPQIQRRRDIDHNGRFVSPLGYASAHHARALPTIDVPTEERSFSAAADLPAIRAFVYSFAKVRGMPETRALDLATAVDEIAMNSLEHGDGEATVRIWAEGAQVFCDVDSPGSFETGFATLIPPSPQQNRGRGLWMAGQLCDLISVRVRDEITTVRLQMLMAYL